MPPKPQGTIIGQITQEFQTIGREAAKSTAKAVGDILNPMNVPEDVLGPTLNPEAAPSAENPNATPIDMSAITRKQREHEQQKKDQEHMLAIRQQFNIVKKEERKAREELDEEEQERLYNEQMEAQHKEQAAQQEAAEPAGDEPAGKSPMGMRQQQRKQQLTERKPNSGKQ